MPLVGRKGRLQADLPVTRVGLLQNEAEMPRTPGYDLFPFFTGRVQWDVELFTEHTFGGIGSPSRLDALIVGYNSVHLSDAIREAFDADPPTTNLVVLHQLRPECLAFLSGDLTIRTQPVPGDLVRGAWLPKERSRESEVLLSWPALVEPEAEQDRTREVATNGAAPAQPAAAQLAVARAGPDAAHDDAPLIAGVEAVRYLEFEPGGAWRVVLEARADTPLGRRRLPVVVRTADFIPQRVVVCTLLLESKRDAALVENMVTYAATGWPEVAVVDLSSKRTRRYDASRITERLRLQGARAIRVEVEQPSELDVGQWPLVGVDRIVVPESIEDRMVRTTEAGKNWMRRGGTLVRASPDGGLTIHTGVTDKHWVARRWAAWFSGTRPERWQGSLFATRAVLRTLVRLHEEVGDQREDLGVNIDPDGFRAPVARLLAARLRQGNAEHTIGPTVAGLDIFGLVGRRSLSRRIEGKTRRWLRKKADDPATSVADRLDIARCLKDHERAVDAIAAAENEPPSATLAVRLRETILGLATFDGHRPRNLLPVSKELAEHLNDPPVVDELLASPLLSAEFVDAAYRFHRAARKHPLGPIDDAVRHAAVTGMSALRGLAPDTGLERADPYAISMEAQALLAYVANEPISAFRIRPEARELPVRAVRAVLEETLTARTREQETLRDVSALGTTVHVLGAISLAFAGIVLGALWGLDVRLDTMTGVVIASGVVVAGAVLGLLRWVLLPWLARRRPDLRPEERREIRLAQFVLGVLVLAAATALATALIDVPGVGVGPVIVITGAAALAAAVFYELNRHNLAPPWMSRLLGLVTQPSEVLKWARERSERPRERS